MKYEFHLSRVAHADLHTRGCTLPEAVLLSHISLIKRCSFASLAALYIELNRDWFIDIPAKKPRDLAEQAPTGNKVIEREWEGKSEKVTPDLQS